MLKVTGYLCKEQAERPSKDQCKSENHNDDNNNDDDDNDNNNNKEATPRGTVWAVRERGLARYSVVESVSDTCFITANARDAMTTACVMSVSVDTP